MGKTKKCLRCRREMRPKDSWTPSKPDAKQCKDCRRKQQLMSSKMIKKKKRLETTMNILKRKGIKKLIEDKRDENILDSIDKTKEDLKKPITIDNFDILNPNHIKFNITEVMLGNSAFEVDPIEKRAYEEDKALIESIIKKSKVKKDF